MPINYKEYPANWKTEIRPRIMKRAGEVRDGFGDIFTEAKCENCNLPNKMLASRHKKSGYVKDMYNGPVYMMDVNGKYQPNGPPVRLSEWPGNPDIQIVLTVAHLDHDKKNNEDSNLKALCQKCHLSYDAKHHAKNARETRRKKKKQLELELL